MPPLTLLQFSVRLTLFEVLWKPSCHFGTFTPGNGLHFQSAGEHEQLRFPLVVHQKMTKARYLQQIRSSTSGSEQLR